MNDGRCVQAAGGMWISEAWAGLDLPALWGHTPHPFPLGRSGWGREQTAPSSTNLPARDPRKLGGEERRPGSCDSLLSL